MNVLRLSAAATVVAALLATVAAVGSCGPGQIISDCTIPTEGEPAADGGPDPCHCAPPPSLNITTCPCLSGNPQEVDGYNACMATAREEEDAGAEGGPLPGCTGQCWPPPPAYWMSPLLLWFGSESSAPECPPATPFVYYDGYSGNTFALACIGGASGACPVPGEVCGPAYADGFSQCVIGPGDVDCPMLAPYTEERVYYEETDGQPSRVSTFCCLPSPPSSP